MSLNNKHNKWFLLVAIIAAVFNCQTEVALPELPYDSRVIIQGVMEPDSVPVVRFNRRNH